MPKRTYINLRALVAAKSARNHGEHYTYERIAEVTETSLSTVYSLMNNRNKRVDIEVMDKLLDWLNEDRDEESNWPEVTWGDLMIRRETAEDEESPESKTPLAEAV